MALSEREQKLLEQMEQALYAEDPRFADRIRTQGLVRSRQRLLIGLVGVLAGLGLVFLGVLNQLVWLGAVGFALMVAGGVFAFAPGRQSGPTGTVQADGRVTGPSGSRSRGARASRGAGDQGTQRKQGKTGKPGKSGTFMQRLEQRWERRSRDEW